MSSSSSVSRLAVAAAACITLMGGYRLHAQEAGLSEVVRVGLARYADLDPLAVTWSESIEATPLGREKIAEKKLGDFITGGAKIQQVAFREGRIYVRCEKKGSLSSPPRIAEIAFDCTVLYLGNPGLGNPKEAQQNFLKSEVGIVKRLPKNDHPEGCYYTIDYFRAAGIRLPTRIRELVPSWRPQSELLASLTEGGRVEATDSANLEGRPLIRVQVAAKDWRLQGVKDDLSILERHLRSKSGITEEEVQKQLGEARKRQEFPAPQRRYDFYLDPKCGYAVRRLETRDEAGHLLTRSDCTDHEHLSGRDVWMPRRCRVEQYTFAKLRDEETLIPYVFDSPLYVNYFQVSAFDVKPWPYERFELKYTAPGTWVNDGTFPEVKGKTGIFYQIPANPQQLDEEVATARARYQRVMNSEKWSPWLRWLIIVANGALLAALVVYILARRWKAIRKA
ncbi:MAG TPA: hypothetical protein VMF69_28950 [Gemmataceae bacterium]|nr:hypothetical protein [Gemmataceae bacterium]